METLRQWWHDRIPIDLAQVRAAANEPVPYHMKKWWFCLGGTPAYLFLIQIATGVLLAFYYQPSATSAYGSVEFITNEAAYGWYFRSVHKWAATLMIAAVILHQMRVFFTGAYRAPRELNWVVGMGLLLCTLGLGFTGYSLVFEQLSYWGATVGANICRTVPVVGDMAAKMLLGGDTYSTRTLSRFYVLHAAILPATVVGLLGVHFGLMRLQGISDLHFKNEPKDAPKTFNFFPDHVYTEIIMGLMLMVLLSALATLFPAGLGPKADPLTTPDVIKPEWFFFATFRWLKLFSITTAVLSMGLVACIMFVWPWIDAVLCRMSRRYDWSVLIGGGVALMIIGLTVWEALVEH